MGAGRPVSEEILEGVAVACYGVDRDLRLRWASRKAEEYWLKRMGALIGVLLPQAFPEVVGTAQYDALVAAARDGVPSRLEAISPIFGRWLSFDMQPSAEGAVVTFRDIHDHKMAEAALSDSEARFNDMAANFPGLIYRRVMYPDGRIEYPYVSDSVEKLFGAPAEAAKGMTSLAQFATYLAPADLARWTEAVRASAQTLEPTDMTLRLRGADGRVRWVRGIARPHRRADGAVVWDGVNLDITEHKETEERQLLLMAELDHRVKNILAIVQALARRSLAGPDGPKVFSARLAALARTHGLLSQHRWKGVGLAVLVQQALAPFAGARLEARGPDLVLLPRAAQSLSLVFHELATNAAKYGALSASGGQVSVDWQVLAGEPSMLHLSWVESGGPATAEPKRRGFGSQLIERTMVHELQGSAALHFRPEGLVASLSLPTGELLSETAVGSARPLESVAAMPANGRSLAGKRVLIAEDMALVAQEMADSLTAAGLTVVGPAARLDEGIRMALAEPVDAAVLDVNLDGEYVWPLATLLRQRGVPTLLVTGYDAHSLPDDVPRMTKPVDLDALKSWLSESLTTDRTGS